jgi:hypothetical protein
LPGKRKKERPASFHALELVDRRAALLESCWTGFALYCIQSDHHHPHTHGSLYRWQNQMRTRSLVVARRAARRRHTAGRAGRGRGSLHASARGAVRETCTPRPGGTSSSAAPAVPLSALCRHGTLLGFARRSAAACTVQVRRCLLVYGVPHYD